MTSITLHEQAKRFVKAVPVIRTGFTVRVHERIQEGSKERVQVFEGLVISVHKGHTQADASFTVRKIVSGVGVEKIFSLHSPNIEKIEVKKVAKVRRAKLFFIRGRTGKAARMAERFTASGEFDPVMSATMEESPAEDEAEVVEETPVEEAPATEEAATEPAPTEEKEEPKAEEKPEESAEEKKEA